ncbi:MAG TPA: DUF3800 domain-containing protein [Aquimonas sp.]|nr:DUF3800 domain-containing protein [Aquimonas sp.]
MHIYIDESGVFRVAEHDNAWCVVAALVVPEPVARRIAQLLIPYKLACGKRYDEEVKLGELTDDQIMSFLGKLSELDCTVYCVASEMSLVTEEQAHRHQAEQVAKITQHIDKMKYAEGRAGLQKLADDVSQLSPQLYMQLVCQAILVKEVIDRGILYHVQRTPKCLRRFRWRIDQKNTSKSLFEVSFEKIAPSLLQSMALSEPYYACTDFDYSAMNEFVYTEENAPTYLRDTYGLQIDAVGGLNIGKILRTDMGFPDSLSEPGIQAVDLVASSIGRLLRGRFADEDRFARALGRLMVQNLRGEFPIRLVSFGATDVSVTDRIANIVRAFDAFSKRMLLRGRSAVSPASRLLKFAPIPSATCR